VANAVEVSGLSPVHFAQFHDPGAPIEALLAAYEREKDAPDLRRTHHFGGRFENIYIPADRLPELAPIRTFVVQAAARVLDRTSLRHGFWFNEMHPGQRTTLHSHEEDDELLSGVFYLACPANSGRLILHDDEAQIVITPRAGRLVLFPPDLPHEVEQNDSTGTRLSIAFNFGPADSAT